MDAAIIDSQKLLAAQLIGKPKRWAETIASRGALRALPYMFTVPDELLKIFLMAALRANVISWTGVFLQGDLEGDNYFPAATIAGAVARNLSDKYANTKESRAAQLATFAAARSANAASNHHTAKAVAAAEAVFATVRAARASGAATDVSSIWAAANDEYGLLADQVEDQTVFFAPLWPNEPPQQWTTNLGVGVSRLLSIDPNYSVWIDWYERRIRGERAAFDIPGDKGRVEDKKILRRLAEATDEDFWGKGHEYVNATLKGWLDEARARVAPPPIIAELSGTIEFGVSATAEVQHSPAKIAAALQNQASPQAQIVDGKLDAAPNTVFDKPQYSDNLADLPSELLAFTEVILNSLPRNCQPVVRNCFNGFRDEMLVRGNRPILNIVKAMAASLTAELYGEPDPSVSPDDWQLKDPREWGAGMDSMFASFFKGYHDLIHHFPMDVEREEFIAATPIDEVAASGIALTEPIDAVAELIKDLGKQGFATENIVRIIEAHQLYNRDVSQLPTPDQPTDAISPKRRHVLGTAGFYLHTYSVLGSTASLASWPVFQALLPKLKDAIDALLAFIR